MSNQQDPGFLDDVMAMEGHHSAKQLLLRLGCVEWSEVCEHSWHRDGTVNGVPVDRCQACGAIRLG
jgi:hypothetical protein